MGTFLFHKHILFFAEILLSLVYELKEVEFNLQVKVRYPNILFSAKLFFEPLIQVLAVNKLPLYSIIL